MLKISDAVEDGILRLFEGKILQLKTGEELFKSNTSIEDRPEILTLFDNAAFKLQEEDVLFETAVVEETLTLTKNS